MDADATQPGTTNSTAQRKLRLSHCPQRSQRLLQELFDICAQWLRQPLQDGLDTFCGHLFDLAEHSRNSVDQQACMNCRDRVLRQRDQFEEHVVDMLANLVEHIGEPVGQSAGQTSANAPLSLVNIRQQDTAAALETLAVRGTVRGGLALIELGYRMAALLAKPPLEARAQPLGPYAFALALHTSMDRLDLADGQDLYLLRHFERAFSPQLTPLYEKLNAHLVADGLLPQLRPFSTSAAAHPSAADHQTTATAQPNPAPRDPSAPPVRQGRRATDVVVSAGNESSIDFDDLRQLLAQFRGHPQRSTAGARIASGDELQAALSGLQRHPDEMVRPPGRELGSAQHLRDELLGQINANRSDSSGPATLNDEQSDTLELVCMLFEQLGKQIGKGSNAHNVLSSLQVPLLRMAVSDHEFFEQSKHPARHLLGTVTRAASEWLDAPDSDPDRSLETKLEELIDRANREPPSAGLYTSLLADIEKHLDMLKRRAQGAERRQVETITGRERLERACQQAGDLMAERFAVSAPHGLLRALLDRAWTDVLALTLVRHGEASPNFSAQLTITDQLLGRAQVSDRKQLQTDVQTGLMQIGMATQEAEQVAERLVAGGNPTPRADPLSNTEMLLRLKQKQRLGGSASTRRLAQQPRPANAAAPDAAAAASDDPAATAPAGDPQPDAKGPVAAVHKQAPVDPRITAIEANLRQLPFGTWFEFADDDSGRWVQRKLAWYSPMSRKVLFVNRRGQQGREMKLMEVARAIAMGHARELRLSDDGLLDRAWNKLMTMLRQDTRDTSTATEAR